MVLEEGKLHTNGTTCRHIWLEWCPTAAVLAVLRVISCVHIGTEHMQMLSIDHTCLQNLPSGTCAFQMQFFLQILSSKWIQKVLASLLLTSSMQPLKITFIIYGNYET